MIEPAASRRRGLGRGLELLIGPGPTADELVQIPVGSIRPNTRQPRRRFDGEAASELAESIRVQGVIQPVLVRAGADGSYELIAGERRWRAARLAGLATVPALVRDVGERDALLLALVENVAREDLSPVEESRAYAALMDEFDLSLGEVAERVGRSKSSVSNRLRLLELPEDVLALLERGQLTEGHARAILAVPDHDQRRELARQIVRRGLSVRAAERAARWAGARRRPRRPATAPVDPVLADRARAALEAVTGAGARVAAGRLVVAFEDETGLAEIVEALERASALLAADAAR
ncbi:MAG: ParB/RepB/Spo0J family partition protein [Thermoleophilia bacterium]|nr:ParB/RepB/Spo0J family partition protein [Thermoleophilia bacterium]